MALVSQHCKPMACWKNLRCIVAVRLKELSRECSRPWTEARLHLRSLHVIMRHFFVERWLQQILVTVCRLLMEVPSGELEAQPS